MTQFLLIGVIFFGDTLFGAIGMPIPEFYQSVKENKVMAFAMVWFICNMIIQNLLSTGAFEIVLNGVSMLRPCSTCSSFPCVLISVMTYVFMIKLPAVACEGCAPGSSSLAPVLLLSRFDAECRSFGPSLSRAHLWSIFAHDPGQEVWSKLQTGQLPPSIEHLYEIIDKIKADAQ